MRYWVEEYLSRRMANVNGRENESGIAHETPNALVVAKTCRCRGRSSSTRGKRSATKDIRTDAQIQLQLDSSRYYMQAAVLGVRLTEDILATDSVIHSPRHGIVLHGA